MAITKFIPEVWSASLLTALEKALVFGSIANTDYEGDISAYGDTVHITNFADPSISPYTRNTNLGDPEALTDEEQLLQIDQANSFNFQVDDLDAAQVRNSGAVMTEATQRASYGLRDKADRFLASRIALGAENALGVIDGTTASNVYDTLLVPASVAMDEASVPEEMRWMVLDPAAYGKLRLDGRFIKVNESGSNALRNGVVGEAAGFRILKSNNAANPGRTAIAAKTTNSSKEIEGAVGTFNQGDVGLSVTGTGVGTNAKVVSVTADGSKATVGVNSTATANQTDIAIVGVGKLAYFGSSIGLTYAQQILKVEGYRPEKRFADALKGLHVYGGKVTRGEALGVASVKTA